MAFCKLSSCWKSLFLRVIVKNDSLLTVVLLNVILLNVMAANRQVISKVSTKCFFYLFLKYMLLFFWGEGGGGRCVEGDPGSGEEWDKNVWKTIRSRVHSLPRTNFKKFIKSPAFASKNFFVTLLRLLFFASNQKYFCRNAFKLYLAMWHWSDCRLDPKSWRFSPFFCSQKFTQGSLTEGEGSVQLTSSY